MAENTVPDVSKDISAGEQERIISEYRRKSKRLPGIIVGCVAIVFLGWGLAYIFPVPYMTPGDIFLSGIVLLMLIFSASVYFYYRCPRCRAPLPTKGAGANAADDVSCPKCGVRLK